MSDPKPKTTNDDYLGDGVYIGRIAYAGSSEIVLWTERLSEEMIIESHWMVLEDDMVDKLINYRNRANE